MSINIADFFSRPDYSEWKEAAAKTLRLNDLEALEKSLNFQSVEGIDLRTHYHQATQSFYLKTFPVLRTYARETDKERFIEDDLDGDISTFITTDRIDLKNKANCIQKVSGLHFDKFSDDIVIDFMGIYLESNCDQERTIKYIQSITEKCDVKFLVDTSLIHNAGGSIIQELAFSFGLAHYLLNELDASKLIFNVSVDSLFFTNIAKLRALRFVWERVLEEHNLSLDSFQILTHNSKREQTLFDPWVNMLRNTTSASAAFIGGADITTTLSYDSLITDYNLKADLSSMGARQSRNILHILLEESSLANVLDPSAGSYTIESLTHEISALSFDYYVEKMINRDFLSSLDLFSEEVLKVYEKRVLVIEKRRLVLAGINDFVNTEEEIKESFGEDISFDNKTQSLFPLRRVSEKFEQLRLMAAPLFNKKPIRIYAFGEEANLSGRIMFCKNYFEVFGAECEVELKSLDDLCIETENLSAVVFCAEDKNYDEIFTKLDYSNKKLPSFVAGKKFLKEGVQNIFMGQNIFEVLTSSFFKGDSCE